MQFQTDYFNTVKNDLSYFFRKKMDLKNFLRTYIVANFQFLYFYIYILRK